MEIIDKITELVRETMKQVDVNCYYGETYKNTVLEEKLVEDLIELFEKKGEDQ